MDGGQAVGVRLHEEPRHASQRVGHSARAGVSCRHVQDAGRRGSRYRRRPAGGQKAHVHSRLCWRCTRPEQPRNVKRPASAARARSVCPGPTCGCWPGSPPAPAAGAAVAAAARHSFCPAAICVAEPCARAREARLQQLAGLRLPAGRDPAPAYVGGQARPGAWRRTQPPTRWRGWPFRPAPHACSKGGGRRPHIPGRCEQGAGAVRLVQRVRRPAAAGGRRGGECGVEVPLSHRAEGARGAAWAAPGQQFTHPPARPLRSLVNNRRGCRGASKAALHRKARGCVQAEAPRGGGEA